MCHESLEIFQESNTRNKRRVRFFFEPVDNPLYDYLIELQLKRIQLVNALALNRLIAFQIWIFISFITLWLLNVQSPSLAGFPAGLMILFGPLLFLTVPYFAGFKAQVIAVQNYPSPLDSPSALELLLSTPLTEREIIAGTIVSNLRWAFLSFSKPVMLPGIINITIWSVSVAFSLHEYPLTMTMFCIAMIFYLPTLASFIFLPVLSAIDQFMVPKDWIHRSYDATNPNPVESIIGRSGQLPFLATAISVVPVVIKANQLGPTEISTITWVLLKACPIIILCLAGTIALIIALLPVYLRYLRR
jgi:hypothetical protein